MTQVLSLQVKCFLKNKEEDWSLKSSSSVSVLHVHLRPPPEAPALEEGPGRAEPGSPGSLGWCRAHVHRVQAERHCLGLSHRVGPARWWQGAQTPLDYVS